MSDKNEMIMPFERLNKRTIQKDDDLDKTLFSDVYKQASGLVETIIASNRLRRDEQKRSGIYIGNKIASQNITDINNVIAFIGRRGTGKTSAMLAFAESLENGGYNAKEYPAISNAGFTVLPYVDASMTGIRDEDFFEIIIFKMLKYLEDFSEAHLCADDEELHRLEEKFALIYSHYSGLNHDDNAEFLPSYSVMRKRMEKHNIRGEIIELVPQYTAFISKKSGFSQRSEYDRKGDNYLVICIDDIDMARKAHIDIMQLIYQYFMIPGVIVLVTMNFKPLFASVKKEFYSSVTIKDDKTQVSSNLQLSQEQSLDYMRKIIPSDMRISMPSWKKMDLRNSYPIRIGTEGLSFPVKGFDKLSKSFVDKLIAVSENNSDGTTGVSPKKLLMLLLADRTKCYLDTEGHKFHFMEPESLRGLYDLFYLLYNMKSVDDSWDSQNITHLNYNRKVLLNFLYFRLIPDYGIEYEESKVIKKIEGDTIDRRGREIWEYYYQCFMKSDNREKTETLYGTSFVRHEEAHHSIENYNFGEVFRVLYCGSRLNLYDKQYVKSVLAIYSFILPQFVEKSEIARIEHHKAPNGATDNTFDRMYAFRELSEVFGYSLLGEWCGNLFNNRHISIVINKKIFFNNIDNTEMAENSIKHLLYLLLLSRRSSRKPFGVVDETWLYRIDADLDPTSFIIGKLRIKRLGDMKFLYDDETYKIWELIEKFYYDCRESDNPGLTGDVIREMVERTAQEIYGKEYFDEGDIKPDSNDINLFLLKNTDITYNVIKRTVKNFLYSSDGNLDIVPSAVKRDKNPFEIIKTFYVKMEEELKKITSVYGICSEKIRIKNNAIVDWFMSSESYGKYSCIIDTEEGKSAVTEDKNLFYCYGCGMEYIDRGGNRANYLTFNQLISFWFNDIALYNEYEENDFLWIYHYLRYTFEDKLNIMISADLFRKLSSLFNKYIGNMYSAKTSYKLDDFENDISYLLDSISGDSKEQMESTDKIFKLLDRVDVEKIMQRWPENMPDKITKDKRVYIINRMHHDMPFKDFLDIMLGNKPMEK